MNSLCNYCEHLSYCCVSNKQSIFQCTEYEDKKIQQVIDKNYFFDNILKKK